MTNIPTDAVHRLDALACVGAAESFQTAFELAARKAELRNQRLSHEDCLLCND
jgi:hypothetical protein